MGNRGVLHNAQREIVRDSAVKRWIACLLEFKRRHRAVMQPNGTRSCSSSTRPPRLRPGTDPCAECRREDFARFRAAWQLVHGDGPWQVDAIDARLHGERRLGPWRKRTYDAELHNLPDGTFVALEDRAWLVLGDALLEWSPDRYLTRRSRFTGSVTVLTPPSLVGVLGAGYVPLLHRTASANAPS